MEASLAVVQPTTDVEPPERSAQEPWGRASWPPRARAAATQLYLRNCPPVSPEFEQWFTSRFPDLGEPILRRLLYTVLTNSARARPTPLARNFLRRFDVKNPNNPTGRGHKWICEALSKALGVAYREYSKQHHIARSIQVAPRFAAELLEQWHSFRLDSEDPAAINSATSEPTASTKFERIIRTNKIVLSKSVVERFPHYPLPELLVDINNAKLPASLFERFKIVATDIAARRDAATDDAERKRLDARFHYLRGAEHHAKTGYLYEPVDPAYRIYVHHESLQGIHRDDRRALTRQTDGYFELDLRNAHFSILAMLAESDAMNALLDGGSIWDQLLDYCGLDDSMRDQLKECVTSGMYGAGEVRRQVMLDPDPLNRVEDLYFLDVTSAKRNRSPKALGRQRWAQGNTERGVKKHVRETFNRLMSHSAVVAMVKATKEITTRIKNDGGMVDAFGRFITIPEGRCAGTVVHAVATSYERLLIDVIYRRARKNRFGDFRVVLDQHDGVTIYFTRRDEKRMQSIVENLQHAVREKALSMGINTGLEVKNTEEP